MEKLNQLENRVSQLGNHHFKYLHTINRFLKPLQDAIRESSSSMQIHLFRASFSPSDEMKIIRRLTTDPKQSVQFVSCYYALQFLLMNLRNLDILELGIASGSTPTKVYHHFMMQIGSDFRDLTRAYLENLIDIYLDPAEKSSFFITSVGTRADQDDIDAAIITDDLSDSKKLNDVLKKVTQNMLVYATPLHLYLTENIGQHLYTSSISELRDFLSKEIRDVVIISELLNATFILGDYDLYRQFEKRVVSRYYFSRGQDVKFHEGYLRGILGETRRQILTPLYTDTLCPKDDALRLLKSIVFAKKTIHSIKAFNLWDIVQMLMRLEPEHKENYNLMFRAASFLEIFKFLLQLFLIQDEYFRLNEFDTKQLTKIAEIMGYSPIGTVSAWDQLLVDYYRYVKEIRKLAEVFIEDISNHLKKVSNFGRMIKSPTFRDENGRYKGSLARDFAYATRFFKGVKYWEDILDLLETDNIVLQDFIDGFLVLDSKTRKQVIREYVTWAQFTPITIIRLITIISKKLSVFDNHSLVKDFNTEFINYLKELPYITLRLCRIYSRYPDYIHEYLSYRDDDSLDHLLNILSGTLQDSYMENLRLQFTELCQIHRNSSQYFKRFFSRFTKHHPEYSKYLTNPTQLSKVALGILATVDILATTSEKKKALGDYYDIEFIRTGINAMRGIELHVTNREFTRFCTNYMQKLFDVCYSETENEIPGYKPGVETFTILAAGGHGREQAFDDDFDLIALIDTDNKDTLKFATHIVSKINRELIKRGILTHYRLGEILGSFVNPVSAVIEYLSGNEDESFIDLSQILGARIIIGNDTMENVLKERILDPFIFRNKRKYILRMMTEIYARRKNQTDNGKESINIKEEPGGLRDIEAISLILKAFTNTTRPISQDFFQLTKSELTEIIDPLHIVDEASYFLRTIRDLYRLVVAEEDEIQVTYLHNVSRVLHDSLHPEWGNPEILSDHIRIIMNHSTHACDQIMGFITEELKI